MKRNLYLKLLEWKKSPDKKPLIIRGARQVGKTYLLKEFGKKEYKTHIYLNFEDDPSLGELFKARFDKDKIISFLSAYCGEPVRPNETLLIFDEIQASDAALNSLKYFNENAAEYQIVAAGSLLGIKLSGEKSFPVGKVSFLTLYPMTFFEYLDAIGKGALKELIESKNDFEAFPETFHVELIDILKTYFLVGGMPEAVYAYSREKDFLQTRKIQDDILNAYLLDFSKHAGKSEIIRISELWNSIPLHLSKVNKKMIFSAVREGARGREYEYALQWLENAGLICKSRNVSLPGIPLSAYASRNIFKTYMLDVGLLGALSRLSPDTLIRGNEIFTHFLGAFIENYVGQELVGNHGNPLYYWTSEGIAEIDFILELDGKVLPFEVKAGINPKSKSMQFFNQKFNPPLLPRCNLLNLKKEAKTVNIPLYAVPFIGKLPDLDYSRHVDNPG